MLNLNSLAASPCVISFFLVFFNATSRSLSTWVISSCPSCIPKAWGCQDDISTLLKDDILILLPQGMESGQNPDVFVPLNMQPLIVPNQYARNGTPRTARCLTILIAGGCSSWAD